MARDLRPMRGSWYDFGVGGWELAGAEGEVLLFLVFCMLLDEVSGSEWCLLVCYSRTLR